MRKMFRTVLAVGLTLALMGCPGGGDTPKVDGDPPADTPNTDDPTSNPSTDGGDSTPATTEKKSVDLSHVKVGQKYHYHMVASGMEMDLIYEIKEITDTELNYEQTTIMNGKPVGPAAPGKWSIPAPAGDVKVDPKAPKVTTSNETISAAGQDWDCMVSESAGTKTWIPMKNGMNTWPMFIKTMKDGKVTNELTKIE